MRMFQEEISIWIYRLSNAEGPQGGWASSNALRAWIKQKKSGRKENSLSLPDCQPGISVFSCPWTRLIPTVLLVLRPSDSDWNYTMGSLGSPACWWLTVNLLSLHNPVSQFLIISRKYLSISVYLSIIYIYWLFLWRTLNTLLILFKNII